MPAIPSHYAHVFSRLRGLRTLENGWESWCPAHEDERPRGGRSLSIRIGGKGQLILRCHGPGGGCETPAVLKNLALEWDDTFPDNAHTTGRRRMSGDKDKKRTFLCAYDYNDEAGRLLFQVVRWSLEGGGKTFSQRRPNPDYDPSRKRSDQNREWIGGIDGVRRVLYRLPQLISGLAARPDRWVFVHEGEKAVLAGESIGMVGTCSPMGAGRWNSLEYCLPLAGCNVCVIEDDDPVDEKLGYEPGKRHATDVLTSLLGVAARLKKIRLSQVNDKSDFYDWLDAKKKAAMSKADARRELAALVNAAPDWLPDPADLAPSVLRIAGCLARRRMAAGGETFASRDEAIGATLVAYQNWLASVSGRGDTAGAVEDMAAVLAQSLDDSFPASV